MSQIKTVRLWHLPPLSYLVIGIGLVVSVIGASLYSVVYYNSIKCESNPYNLCPNVQSILRIDLYLVSLGIAIVVLGLVTRVMIDRTLLKKMILALIIGLLLTSGLVAFEAAQPVAPSSSGKYSELGLLNSQLLSGAFPGQIVAGQKLLIYVYIGNHEGGTEHYEILLKLGNSSTVVNSSTYANLSAISTYLYVLSSNQTVTFPVNISINQTGINQRLIFEPWDNKTSSSDLGYTGIWQQLWLNVTKA